MDEGEFVGTVGAVYDRPVSMNGDIVGGHRPPPGVWTFAVSFGRDIPLLAVMQGGESALPVTILKLRRPLTPANEA